MLRLPSYIIVVDAREDMATDGEASIHIIKYNAGLVNRDTKRAGPPQVNPPVGFPSQYSADIINKRQIGKVGDKPLTGFPSRYRADLIDSKE